MRRRFFWGMVAVAVVTLAVGGLAAAVLINRSLENSERQEFLRQANATARIVEADLARTSDSPGRSLAVVLATVASIGGHDYVEAAIVGPRGTVTVLSDGAVLIDLVPDLADLTGPIHFDATVEGTDVLVVAQPFRVGERGTVVVVIGTTLDLVPWRDVLGRFAWALVLAVLLAALLAGWFASVAGRRLDALRMASDGIARGDFSARVQLEGSDEVAAVAQAFNQMAIQLEEARRREREFLVSVGHDLRTPLTTIAGYAEAIQEDRVSPDDMDRVAAVLGTEASRLGRLVEDLMLLARLEAREFSLRPEQVDLAKHLAGVVQGFRPRADAARVRLETDLADVGVVDIDPDRVAQIAGNLLENALRYTPETGRVRLVLRHHPAGLAVEVSDTGPGIDAADIPHIFERLYVTTRYRPLRPEGSGLGLAIVRELVDAMGGRTEVEAKPEGGTLIRVVLGSGQRAESSQRQGDAAPNA
ncbi:MAG TPA: HAMP domain-containing sensor histidine kinase [Acidimicrobiia bacterium]|nr:HAMP domain-containing sensor histidine kinase [Acidimicrobiia bacterium]